MPARPRGRIKGSVAERTAAPEPSLVYEGRAYRRGRIDFVEIGVDESGVIVAVGRTVRGGKHRSLGDVVILPSAIDVHAHFRDPGPPGEVENFDTGTRSAALGGIGAAVDMPNTNPPTTSVERVEEKIGRIRRLGHVDLIPFAVLLPGSNTSALARVASGFKLYMAPTTGDLSIPQPDQVGELMRRVAETGLPLHVHAEDPRKLNEREPPSDTDAWDRARPASSEVSAISQLLGHPPELRLHVCHVTSKESLDRARDIGASSEVTPHHLLLSSSLFGGTWQKVNPPLRAESVRRDLFSSFKEGRIPMLASDHAPHSMARKELGFPEAPSGVPGEETMMPLMFELARRGQFELSTLINASCRHPALFLGLQRGRIEVGLEADFVTVDFRKGRKVRARDLAAPCGWTPFEGSQAIFPIDHYLMGTRIVEGGEFTGGRKGRALRVPPLTYGPKGPQS